MKLTKKFIFVGFVFLSACSGGGDDSPPPVPDPPSAAILVFPQANSECTTGISLSNNISEVTFEWEASANTDLYTLNVVNLNTTVPQTLATTSLSATLAIAKGAAFSWSVTTSNTESQVTTASENRLFYNAGSQLNYPPFPAQVISPESGATIKKNENDEVVFLWSGADVENDIDFFELFLSDTSSNDMEMVYNGPAPNFTIDGLSSETVYFWKVITTDAQGNTSDSGTYDFKVQ